MDISAGLIAKGTLGTAAAAGAGYLGYNYRDEISSYIFRPKGEELPSEISSANKKLGKLGFGDCKFGKDWAAQNCGTLDESKLKAIKFDGKRENDQNAINRADGVTLKIEKISEIDIFPDGIKIIFETNEDVNIPKTSNENITLKKNTNPEFKIKGDGDSLTIERAWSVGDLAKKIKLRNCTNGTSEKTCDLPEGKKINVYLGDQNYAVDMDITESDSTKKVTYEEDQEGYNQGLKFTVTEDVNVSGGKDGKKAGTVTKIEKAETGNTSYEIKEQTIGGEKIWFLSKKP